MGITLEFANLVANVAYKKEIKVFSYSQIKVLEPHPSLSTFSIRMCDPGRCSSFCMLQGTILIRRRHRGGGRGVFQNGTIELIGCCEWDSDKGVKKSDVI